MAGGGPVFCGQRYLLRATGRRQCLAPVLVDTRVDRRFAQPQPGLRRRRAGRRSRPASATRAGHDLAAAGTAGDHVA